MIFTSDQSFFDRIGEDETKRYFAECYKFICNYKNLGEKNIIAAAVHLDEGTPHLMFVPVVHTKDKDGKKLKKCVAEIFGKVEIVIENCKMPISIMLSQKVLI